MTPPKEEKEVQASPLATPKNRHNPFASLPHSESKDFVSPYTPTSATPTSASSTPASARGTFFEQHPTAETPEHNHSAKRALSFDHPEPRIPFSSFR